MTSDAAMALSTLLTVVLFAYFVEAGPAYRFLIRANTRQSRFGLAGGSISLLVVVGYFIYAQLPLLAVMNGTVLARASATSAWFGCANSFAMTLLGFILFAAFRPAE